MRMEINRIYNMDCLEGMKLLEDNSVDVSFTSPPYNTKSREQDYEDNGDLKLASCSKHTKYKHSHRPENWVEWQCSVIDEMLRVTKKYVLYNVQGIKECRSDVYKLIGKYADRIHDIVMWYKPNGCPTGTPNKISNKYEFLLIIKCDGCDGVSVNSRYYGNVITTSVNPNREYANIHKAVMSKSFCDEVIREFTSDGDTVLDPFMGIGTTAVCCIENNRNYIGFEIFEEYVNIAENRIRDAVIKKNSSLW